MKRPHAAGLARSASRLRSLEGAGESDTLLLWPGRDPGPAAPRGGPHRPLPPWPRSIAVVGNAPEVGAHGAAIDRADWVVRFNNAHGLGGATGKRVTHLFLVNFGGQTREWLEDEAFHRRPSLRSAQNFILPFDPGPKEMGCPTPTAVKRRGGEHDWTPEIAARLKRSGRPIWLVTDPLFAAAKEALRREGTEGEPIPSTGFLSLFLLLRQFRGSNLRPDVYGFGFAGWEGHAWEAERRWFERQDRAGRLRLHALPGRGSSE